MPFGWFSKKPRLPQLKPGRGWTTEVVGEASYQPSIAASYRKHGGKASDLKVTARLVFDNANPHDGNAIAVTIDGGKVGYLPRAAAAAFRETMQQGGECSAKITGGHQLADGNTAHYGVKLNLKWPPSYVDAP